jgi:transposase
MQTCYQELTDSQWEIIEKIINSKRKRWHSLRTVCNALLWIVYSGSQWRNLESKYPPWQSVYYYFRKWQQTGVWEQILDALVVKERKRQSRQQTPSLLAVDSQSVKTVNFVSLDTGIDGAKKLNGRKRHLAVDTLGLPWATLVTAASVSDTAAGLELVGQLKGKVPRLKKIVADHGYKTGFVDQVNTTHHWQVEIAQRRESVQGFVPQKNRWPVERSFGWLNFRRRLAKDYEKTVESSLAVLQIAFISFLIRRLAK